MEHTTISTGDVTKLTHFGFKTIKTSQVDTKLKLCTKIEHVVRTFDTKPLSRPPSGFKDNITVKYIPFAKFIDIDDLFCRTLLLNDDALKLLLPKLKRHLEVILVCLGALDEWVSNQ
jgi:hypothetical protein